LTNICRSCQGTTICIVHWRNLGDFNRAWHQISLYIYVLLTCGVRVGKACVYCHTMYISFISQLGPMLVWFILFVLGFLSMTSQPWFGLVWCCPYSKNKIVWIYIIMQQIPHKNDFLLHIPMMSLTHNQIQWEDKLAATL
jgi:hypothetical protein